jgi:hypothetical protein
MEVSFQGFAAFYNRALSNVAICGEETMIKLYKCIIYVFSWHIVDYYLLSS